MFYQVHGDMFRPLGGHLQVTVVHKIKITTALFKSKSKHKNMKLILLYAFC